MITSASTITLTSRFRLCGHQKKIKNAKPCLFQSSWPYSLREQSRMLRGTRKKHAHAQPFHANEFFKISSPTLPAVVRVIDNPGGEGAQFVFQVPSFSPLLASATPRAYTILPVSTRAKQLHCISSALLRTRVIPSILHCHWLYLHSQEERLEPVQPRAKEDPPDGFRRKCYHEQTRKKPTRVKEWAGPIR